MYCEAAPGQKILLNDFTFSFPATKCDVPPALDATSMTSDFNYNSGNDGQQLPNQTHTLTCKTGFSMVDLYLNVTQTDTAMCTDSNSVSSLDWTYSWSEVLHSHG